MGLKAFCIHAGDERIDAFLCDSFFEMRSASSSFHSHQYAEVHITLRGKCCFYMEDRELASDSGTLTVIPDGMLHRLWVSDEDTLHIAFLIDYPVLSIVQTVYGKEIMDGLKDEIGRYRTNGELYPIVAYLTFVCKDFIRARAELCHIDNRAVIISEFFVNHYNEDVTVDDLARDLHLCTKQTDRLVQRVMGESFSKVLLRFRIETAKRLLQTDPTLTLAEVAEAVGYGSYNGFWKAFRRFEKKV